ncbi:MAG: hypothetical protein H0T79_14775 [Deltaproteobacteria bacterium]|nr:hypothetical protein [Deltaproteobacteria bacterium]
MCLAHRQAFFARDAPGIWHALDRAMRSAFEELRRFAETANELADLAIGWHLAIGAVVIALLVGWRPSTRLGLAALAAPPASVGMAWLIHG